MTSETELEMVQRYVRYGAKTIERQQGIIREVSAWGVSPHMAESVLRSFAEAQARHVAHLRRLKEPRRERPGAWMAASHPTATTGR